MSDFRGLRVAVTGASGFIGWAVVERLRAGAIGPIAELRLNDLRAAAVYSDSRIIGSYGDSAVRERLVGDGLDVLFHLASLPGGACKLDPKLGKAVNLDGSMDLLDAVAQKGAAKVVYTSSIAALAKGDDPVTDTTPLRPEGTYGAHKAMIELFLADHSQRGALDGRSVRPAGIVARPREAFAGFATAWMSDLFHAAAERRSLSIPAHPDTRIWLQSADIVADNIIHAALMPSAGLPTHRSWTLPATVVRVGTLVEALERHTGDALRVEYLGGPIDQADLDAGSAEAAGFRDDGGVDALVARVMGRIGQGACGTASASTEGAET